MRKILIGLLVATLLTSTVVFADTTAEPIATDVVVEDTLITETDVAPIVITEGTVTNVDLENSQVEVKTETDEIVVYTYSLKTLFVDAKTGDLIPVENFKENTKITIYHAYAETHSIPPMSTAYAFFMNGEESKSFFIEVSNVEKTDNGYTINDARGDYRIEATNETPISGHLTRNIVTLADIESGDRLLFTADVLSASYPAVANPTNIILVKADKHLEEIKDEIEKLKEELELIDNSAPSIVLTEGTFGELNTENATFTATVGEEEKEFIYGPKTIFYDAKTNAVVTENELVKDGKVIIYNSSAQTFSLPPKSPAYAVILNAENGTNAFYIEVGNVNNEDNYSIFDAAGNYELIFTNETPISGHLTRNIVTADDIEIGDGIFFTADVISASIPAIVNPTNMILVKDIFGTKEVVKDLLADIIAEFNVVEKEVNGIRMLPIRVIAENLGYTVEWDNDTQGVTVIKEAKSFTMNIDNETYGFNKSIVKYSSAPKLIDGSTYVPIDFINNLFD